MREFKFWLYDELWCFCLTPCHGLPGDIVIYSLGKTLLNEGRYVCMMQLYTIESNYARQNTDFPL